MGVIPARFVMHGLLGSAYGMNILCRNSVNFIVPYIVEAQGFSEAQAAALLAGFFPGYVITQIPAGLIARTVGEKVLTTVNICANALFFCLLPMAARLGAGPLAFCLTTMGLFQGTIVPCVVGLQVYWLPDEGTEKIWASRALPLGSVVAQILASWLTPRLAAGRTGWHRVVYVYSVVNLMFATLWHMLAADRPRKWRGPPTMDVKELEMLESSSPESVAQVKQHHDQVRHDPEPVEDGSLTRAKQAASAALGVRELMRVPAAIGCCCSAFAIGTLVYTLTPRAPSYFMSELKVSPLRTGQLLALPPVVMQAADMLTGVVEALLLARGWQQLAVRKLISCSGMLLGGAALCAFANTKTAIGATLCHCLASATVSVHGSGYAATYREVGGADATLLSSLANTCANVPGFLAPMFSLALRRWSGWGLSFGWPAMTLVVAAAVYFRTASLEPARATIERSRRQPDAATHTSLSVHVSTKTTANRTDRGENGEMTVVVTAMLHNGQSVTLEIFDKNDVGLDIKRALVAHPIAKELSALGPFVATNDLHLVTDGKRLLDSTPLSVLSGAQEAEACRVQIFVLQEEMLDEEMREKLEKMSTL